MPINDRSKPRASLLLSLAVLTTGGLTATPALAQNFETHYGETSTLDIGEDIKAVRYCPGGGSIVAGTRRVPGFGSEALVTRVADNGLAIWQFAYRPGGGNATTAQAITEIRFPRGFAITGAMLRGSTLYPYVMRLECNGQPRWARMLDNTDPSHRAAGHDLVEVYDPAGQGELVMVGDEISPTPAGNQFGRIARLDGNGNVLWNHAYAANNYPLGLRFHAVSGNRSATSVLDDLVVGGAIGAGNTWDFDRRALLFRVDSSGMPICNAFMGLPGPENEEFRGITRQDSPAHLGGSVLVGSRSDPLAIDSERVYMVRFERGFCLPLRQASWRDANFAAGGHDLIETTANPAALPGAIAATGSIRGSTPNGNGFVLLAHPAGLFPVFGSIQFGNTGPRAETLVALDQKQDRFVLAGSTRSDWAGAGDPLDFYMVQTTTGMRTTCAVPWQPLWQPEQLPYERFEPAVKRIPFDAPVQVQVLPAHDMGYCCPLDPG
ncbi:MAG: hypothetical protein KF823_16155 [Xanthomonadales bacterium]|nr:hypothetical protein [Xanthomonadales bacterium]